MRTDKYSNARLLMVEKQLRHRGLKDERVLSAMEEIPRHLFVDSELTGSAYSDCALPIGEDQTISQPYMVALMTELLEMRSDEKVLEIGTGSGYQTALLSRLASEVFSIERVKALSTRAERLLGELQCSNVKCIVGDGTLGLPEESPFDAILVTAAAPEIPQAYIDQLKTDGRLVIPVGSRYSQVLYQVTKSSSGTNVIESTACVFVPLLGEKGWRET